MFHYLKRKKHKPRDPIPGWVKWAVLAFIAYAVITNPNRNTPDETATNAEKNPDAIGVASEKLSQYKNALDSFGVTLRAEDTKTGDGLPIVCGQDVTLAYNTFGEDGKTTGDANPSYTLRLGSGKAIPALEKGIVGMHVGGQRHIFARRSHAYQDAPKDGDENATLRFEVEIFSVKPDLSRLDAALFRVADTAHGNGSVVMCGQPVRMLATVWNADGKKLFETKEPITFTPGASEVALGIEQGVIGMARGGTRTLIIPSSMQKPIHGGKPLHALGMPQPQAVIVDVEVR